MNEKRYTDVGEMLDDIDPALAKEFRKRTPYRDIIDAIREQWSFDACQEPTHDFDDREHFICDVLPELLNNLTDSNEQRLRWWSQGVWCGVAVGVLVTNFIWFVCSMWLSGRI